MKKWLLLLFVCIYNFCGLAKDDPDTVTVGVYINSVHDIDFKEKQYTISMWLWLKYKNVDFDFSKYLEVPMAKSIDKSFYTVDTLDDGRIYMLMKLQCLMKDNWKTENFPFDRQKLRFTIENSQYTSLDLVFTADTVGNHYSKWSISGWNFIPDSFRISTGIKKYETRFGDPGIALPHSEFSNYKIQIGIERDSWWLFLKLFLGMYISFFLSFLSFFIHRDSIDSRFSLNVGALFAVIGNKYVVDSSLPESLSFTLVDSLHGITLLFILANAVCSIYGLKLMREDKINTLRKFDIITCWSLSFIYLVANLFLVYRACS
jgi:hypothetical protein